MRFHELAACDVAGVDWQGLVFDYVPHPDQSAATPPRHPVIVVGAGPVGLALAIDLAQREIPVVVLDSDDRLSTGSRAICFAKRTLEIFDRLGCGDRMVAKGVSWNVGKVFFREEAVYRFDLLPETGHERPAFVNLQQYYVEGYLAERATQLPLIDLRWKNKVIGVEPHGRAVTLTIDTPDGPYRMQADHVAACDGAHSAVRHALGLESKGRTFRDRFLIADVRMKHEAPAERWFWFDPPFHPGRSVLLHRQPDGLWRVDFQLGWDADPEVERRPENIIPRVEALLAHSAMRHCEFELEWASVYTFSCLRMESFRDGRVLFAGDAAHSVSPFGARGANSGVQDADNLAWKLAAVIAGRAPDALLDAYAREREFAADENIRHSTRSTDFITPKSGASRLFRDAVLELAKSFPFARTLVNSGRLSMPATLSGSALNTADVEGDAFLDGVAPGAVAADAPLMRADGSGTWLLRELGPGFTLIVGAGADDDGTSIVSPQDLDGMAGPVSVLRIAPTDQVGSAPLSDASGLFGRRYDVRPGTVHLVRPDQHVCARWRRPVTQQIRAAMRRALAMT